MMHQVRDVLAFPGGDNSSDTVIGGVHFNLSTLAFWNYTLYTNGTVSNGSKCYLTFKPYTPVFLFPNGTFLNATSCYSPVYGVNMRAGVGIGFACLFGLALVLTLVNLTKHGRLHLPAEKRFYPIGRRWQWYWGSFVCATAMISLFTAVDVDRYYLPQLPIILTSFFWFLMQMGIMALVWEAVRHWGSWMERQYVDPDPFSLRQEGRRYWVEFWLPLIFYLFLWLNFFMIVPRSWTPIQHQRSPEQTLLSAEPTATDVRFKIASFFLCVCWLLTVFSLAHSIKHYSRPHSLLQALKSIPLRFVLILPLAAVVPAYQALVAFHFAYSPLRVDGDKAAIFAGGYAPSLLILYIQAFFGFVTPNEDLELRRQRRERGVALDQEMGVVRKPAWWRLASGDVLNPGRATSGESMRDWLTRNARQVVGERPRTDVNGTSPDGVEQDAGRAPVNLEMSPLSLAASHPNHPPPQYTGHSEARHRERTLELAAEVLFPHAQGILAEERERRRRELMEDGPPPPSYLEATREGGRYQDHPSGGAAVGSGNPRSGSVGGQSTRSTAGQPIQVRSMLDV